MKINLIELSNGFKIIHIERENTGVVGMSLVGKAGSSFEQVAGTAHFLEHVAMCGSKKYPSGKKLLSTVRNSGGTTGGSTGKEFVEYLAKVIDSEVESGFDFLSQAVFHSLIKNEKVEKERQIILQEHDRALSNDQRQLFESAISSTFSSETMQKMVLGNKESIEKITVKDLKSFWKKHYTIDNFVMCVCGNIKEDKVKQLGDKYFGDLSSSNKIDFPAHKTNDLTSINILKRQNANQARIILAFSAPSFSSENYYPALLISYILGRGSLSRLNQVIREENQLAYDVSSWIWRGYSYGMFYIEAGISENKINETLALITQELEKISNTPLTSEELSMFKRQIKSYTLFGFENSLQMANYHAKNHLLSSTLTTYMDEFKKIESVTPEEIVKVAIQMFSNKPKLSILAKSLKEEDIHLKELLLSR